MDCIITMNWIHYVRCITLAARIEYHSRNFRSSKLKKDTARLSAANMALALSHPIMAADATSQPDDTPRQIAQIKARIAQLEATQKQADLQRQDSERKLEAKITADELSTRADQTDHFLSPEGFTAGYADGRFVVQSSDGNFVLRPW